MPVEHLLRVRRGMRTCDFPSPNSTCVGGDALPISQVRKLERMRELCRDAVELGRDRSWTPPSVFDFSSANHSFPPGVTLSIHCSTLLP